MSDFTLTIERNGEFIINNSSSFSYYNKPANVINDGVFTISNDGNFISNSYNFQMYGSTIYIGLKIINNSNFTVEPQLMEIKNLSKPLSKLLYY